MRIRLLSFFILIILGLQVRASSDECRSLFSEASYHGNRALGPQIFKRDLREMRNIFTAIKDFSWEDQSQALVAQDNRKIFFHLRVLSQTYAKKDSKFFSKKEETFKNIEYLLGRVQLYQSLGDILTELKEPEVAKVFEVKQISASQDLKKGLKGLGILKNPKEAIQKIENDFRSYDWDSPQKDRKFLLKETLNFAREINENIKNDKYNNVDLEEGLHRLRRRLRELIYRIVNLDGLVSLVDEDTLSPALEQWHKELSAMYPQMSSSPYLPQSAPEINSPFLVGRKSLSVLTQMVVEIGLSKDKDEPLFYIEKAINEGPFDSEIKARALRKLSKIKADSVDSRAVANYYQQRIRDTRLIESIIEFLEENNL